MCVCVWCVVRAASNGLTKEATVASTNDASATGATNCGPQTIGQRMISLSGGSTGNGSRSKERVASANALDATKKVFCFYDIQDDFRPQDLNPCLCTHVIYSYVAVRRNLSFIAGKKGK